MVDSARAWFDPEVSILIADSITISDTWFHPDVCSPFWRWYVSSRPGARITLADGAIIELLPGCAYLIPAWVTFSTSCRGQVRHLFAHFDLRGMPGPLVRRHFPAPWCERLTAADRDQAEELAASISGGRYQDPARLCQLKALVLRALAGAVGAARLPTAPADAVVMPAQVHLDTHLADPPGNRLLARLCGLGEDAFIRRFRRALGQTPAQYGLERRLAEAARLLVATAQPIEGISAECGFADRHHLTRAFARRFGRPPAAFRRRGAM